MAHNSMCILNNGRSARANADVTIFCLASTSTGMHEP